jgi:hypothetical protein
MKRADEARRCKMAKLTLELPLELQLLQRWAALTRKEPRQVAIEILQKIGSGEVWKRMRESCRGTAEGGTDPAIE